MKKFKELGYLILAIIIPLPIILYTEKMGSEEYWLTILIVTCILGPMLEEFFRHISIYKGNGGKVYTWGLMVIESFVGIIMFMMGLWITGILQILSRAIHLLFLGVNKNKGWKRATLMHILFNIAMVLLSMTQTEDWVSLSAVVIFLIIKQQKILSVAKK